MSSEAGSALREDGRLGASLDLGGEGRDQSPELDVPYLKVGRSGELGVSVGGAGFGGSTQKVSLEVQAELASATETQTGRKKEKM